MNEFEKKPVFCYLRFDSMKNIDLVAILKKVTPEKPISFVSTRDTKRKVSFWQSLIQGMADDGGLLIPERIPSLPKELLSSRKFWSTLSISDISSILLRSFVSADDVSDGELVSMLQSAHNFEIPMEKLDKNMWVARLDQGPTASFKDIAARALAKFIELYCEKHNERINIIVATSGDTGVAVADAFGGSSRVSVTVMYPSDGVSEIQEKQMLAVHHAYKNEQVIPVNGNFDVCQDIAKLIQQSRNATTEAIQKLAEDIKFKLGKEVSVKDLSSMVKDVNSLNISSANSINIWRLLPQMTQFFASYASLVSQGEIRPGKEIVFAVPTGNVGHLMAGVYARELGLPIKLFIAGTNANNILANVIGSGSLKHGSFTKTSSPSMDILDPSNLERLLMYIAGKVGMTKKIDLEQMKKDIKQTSNISEFNLKKYGVDDAMLRGLQAMVWVEDVETDEEVYAMMRHIAETSGCILEPHGVTALIASLRARAKGVVTDSDTIVIFETAHPDKFPDALVASGIQKSKVPPHHVLKQIKRKSFAALKKPKAIALDILLVVEKMKTLVTQ